MSVFLIFMGLDLISHSLTHFLESKGSHKPHKPHAHDRISAGSVDIAALSAIAATLVSALLLKNHARIGKALRFAYIESLPSVLSNPSHFLTLSCSTLLLLLPLISLHTFVWLDGLLSVLFAIAMLSLGGSMSLTLGRMLLMSYAGPGINEVIRDIENDPNVSGIDEAKFWQVHYGLCMANLKLRVRGSAEDMTRLRDKITSLVKNRLGGGYGTGGQRWEVSTQLTAEKIPWTTGSGIGR
jgi:Co/Zn/Cd efflux system component